MGIRFIATGHYARVREEGGSFYVCRAASQERDQSYMLYGLSQEILQRLCLPVGEFEKPDIREMAREMGLVSADAPDSQEICFIPDGDYAAFIANRGLADKQGRFIGPNGEDFGPHKGVSHYTVGQRKGLNIAYGQPIFVRRILPNGDIQLALAGDEFYSGIRLRQAARSDGKALVPGEEYLVKIRSRALPAPCCGQAGADLRPGYRAGTCFFSLYCTYSGSCRSRLLRRRPFRQVHGLSLIHILSFNDSVRGSSASGTS